MTMTNKEKSDLVENLPGILSSYFKKMIDAKFIREEAIQFTLELQAWILTCNDVDRVSRGDDSTYAGLLPADQNQGRERWTE